MHQRSVFNDIMDEPKSSARNRSISSNNYTNRQFKSVKKQSSNKYLRPFSPKKFRNAQKSSEKPNIPKAQSNDKNTHDQNEICIIENDDCPSSHRMLRILDTNINTNRHHTASHHKHNSSSSKPTKNQQSLIEKFQSNESKIISMRQELQKVFETFKKREKELKQMKAELKGRDKIKAENQFLAKEITRVQEMIKQALLEREKIKHGPLTKRSNR